MQRFKQLLIGLLIVGASGVAMATEDVVVNQNRQEKSFTGDTGSASVNGDGCHVRVDGKADTVNMRGKRSEITINGAVVSLVVPGRNNKIHIKGGVSNALVGGNENLITVLGTPAGTRWHIEIDGSGNVVQWSKAGGATPPEWVDNGRHNSLKEIP